jgi:hypothetical protein
MTGEGSAGPFPVVLFFVIYTQEHMLPHQSSVGLAGDKLRAVFFIQSWMFALQLCIAAPDGRPEFPGCRLYIFIERRRENHEEVFSFVDESPGVPLFSRARARPLTQKHCSKAGDAYPFAVTTKRIRLHLDNVQQAFCVWITGPYLSPT